MLKLFEHAEKGSIYQGSSHKTAMSKEKMPPNEWNNLWQEYAKVLEKWREVFDAFQKATLDMQKKYNEVMEKAANNSSKDTMKLFGENWQKAMTDAGMNSFKEFSENWQKALNDSNMSTFKQFVENWQKSLSSSGLEQMNAYGEMMKKFTETWGSMWPKSK